VHSWAARAAVNQADRSRPGRNPMDMSVAVGASAAAFDADCHCQHDPMIVSDSAVATRVNKSMFVQCWTNRFRTLDSSKSPPSNFEPEAFDCCAILAAWRRGRLAGHRLPRYAHDARRRRGNHRRCTPTGHAIERLNRCVPAAYKQRQLSSPYVQTWLLRILLPRALSCCCWW
jgi:hypothetical protein